VVRLKSGAGLPTSGCICVAAINANVPRLTSADKIMFFIVIFQFRVQGQRVKE